jgi:hypothetical protein
MKKSLLRESIRKHLLVEKKIAQIVSNIEIAFNLEVDRGVHAFDRKQRKDLEGKGFELIGKHSYEYNQREISNSEIKEVINLVKKEIAEKIVSREINDEVPFIIKSLKWEIALTIIPKFQGGTYWILKVGTVFRESLTNPFRVGKDQLVIWLEE